MRIGWTTESRPMCSAKDCSRNEQTMKAKPRSQTPRLDGMGHQAQAHGRLFGGVLDAHALEHAGQRVGQSRGYRKDIDHRLSCEC